MEDIRLPLLPLITSVAEPRPDGAKITRAVLRFPGEVPAVEDVQVKNRRILSGETDGNVMTLRLSEDDPDASVYPDPHAAPPRPGEVRRGPADRCVLPNRLTVLFPKWGLSAVSEDSEMPVIDRFVHGAQGIFPYSYFEPDLAPGERAPLVVFIPDASVNSCSSMAPLVQGIGATVWAEPEEQEKRPCYVLSIQVPKGVHLGDREGTEESLAALEDLIDSFAAAHAVDPDRIYLTGQSQGCIADLALNYRRPDRYAASLLVAGQWEPEKAGALIHSKFFIGVSSYGPREYAGMTAITENLVKNGGQVTRVDLNFREGIPACDEKVRRTAADAPVVFAVFDGATAFPDDGIQREQIRHHSRGWELTYQLESAREWLFRQRRSV